MVKGESTMSVNMGKLDKVIRIIIVIGLIVTAFVTTQWWLLIFAFMLGVTIFTGFCGIYAFLGIRTCPYKPTVKK